MMSKKARKNFFKLAEFIGQHAGHFPECLPLLKEAFHALCTAEKKIECLKQTFIKLKLEKEAFEGGQLVAVAEYERYDGDNSIVSMSSATEYFTETEDVPPKKKKKKNAEVRSVVEKSDNETGFDADTVESHHSICGQSDISLEHSTPDIRKRKKKKKKGDKMEDSPKEKAKPWSLDLFFLPVNAEEHIEEMEDEKKEEILEMEDEKKEEILEMEDEKKEEILLNTVSSVGYETDPLMPVHSTSEVPTEASVPTSILSMSPRKRSTFDSSSSEHFSGPTFSDQENTLEATAGKSKLDLNNSNSAIPNTSNRTGSPGLRVIPSALLMEKPQQLDVQTPKANNLSRSPLLKIEEAFNLVGREEVKSDVSDTPTDRNVLYFEFIRSIDKRKWLEATDIIMAIKQKDSSLNGCWISVHDMKRRNNTVCGYLKFPDAEPCFKVLRSGIRINGFNALLKLVGHTEDPESIYTQTEPIINVSSPNAAFPVNMEPEESTSTRISPLLYGPEQWLHGHSSFIERGRGHSRGRGDGCGRGHRRSHSGERGGPHHGGHHGERGGPHHGGHRIGKHRGARGGKHDGGHGLGRDVRHSGRGRGREFSPRH